MKSIFAKAIAAAAFVASATAPARAADPIRFSELIFPLETLTAVLWQPFTVEAGYSHWLSQYGTLLPDGTAVIYNGARAANARIFPRSTLSADHRLRSVSLEMVDARGAPDFAFKFATTGVDLKPYPLAAVIAGKLPFFTDEPSPQSSDFSFALGQTEALRIVTSKTRAPGREFIHARFSSSGAEFLTYSETVEDTAREVSYQLIQDAENGGARKFTARKVQYPSQWDGTETYFLDGVPVSLEAFNTAFRNEVLLFVAVQWPPVIGIIGRMMSTASL